MSRTPLSILFGSMLMILSVALAADEAADDGEDVEKSQWLVVHAGTLLAVPGEAPLEARTIVAKDGRIMNVLNGYVGATDVTGGADETDVQFLDLRDSFVLPGLMDMHVHLSFEFDVEGQANHGGADPYLEQHKTVKDDVYALVTAIANAEKTLDAGFTTVRNVGGAGWHIFALRDAINDGNLVGPRILASGHTIRIGADKGSGACSSVESCRRATRKQIDMGADVIKIYATCSGSKPCGHEDAPSVFLEDEIRAVIETATSRELRVAAHAHGTAGINLAASAGVASVDHGSYNDVDSRRIMRRNGTFLVPTLAVQDNIRRDIEDATGSMREVMQEFLDNHGPRMFASHKAGVKIAAGSDAGVTVHGNNARELEMYVEYGLTPEEAIIAATVNAAHLLGKEGDLGTIEGEKIADIIAVQGDPLQDVSALRNVSVVIQNGRVVRDAR